MATREEAQTLWRRADAVTFDVDSTVILDEGIDELAKFCGKGDQVAAMTREAMQGQVTFQESLAVRLGIIKPSVDQIKQFLATHPPRLTAGIRTLVSTLRSKNKQVFLISGGFHCLIAPVAASLNIPPENVFANRLKFYYTGEYAGFDENEPTSKSGGKADVIGSLKQKYNFNTIVHVGDGATDLETVPPADSFIGYGGNVVRDSVKARAPWFVNDFEELIKAL